MRLASSRVTQNSQRSSIHGSPAEPKENTSTDGQPCART
jgi:hypothetical protein